MNKKILNEIKSLLKEYTTRKNKKPFRGMSEKQEKFLQENKGLLFEYYSQVSNPRKDGYVLGDLQVWVYGDDRDKFTPHCHVFDRNKTVEVEISIIDWEIVNIKNGEFTAKMYKAFGKWLNSKSTRMVNATNKEALYAAWDGNNPNNDLLTFVEKHNVSLKDEDLIKYIDHQKKVIK